MAGDTEDRSATTALLALVPMALLLCALSYGTAAQGAFSGGPYHVVIVLIGAALVAGFAFTRVSTWLEVVLRDPGPRTATSCSRATST